VSWSGHSALRSLVGLALLATIRRAALFFLPLLDHVPQRLRALRGFLPAQSFSVAIAAHTLHEGGLFVFTAVTLQLLELRLALAEPALCRREARSQAALPVVDQVLDRLQAFGARHADITSGSWFLSWVVISVRNSSMPRLFADFFDWAAASAACVWAAYAAIGSVVFDMY
jgi:hypothetical protein